jgi:hypothetical protein
LVSPKYELVSDFHSGLASFNQNGKIGFLNKSGIEVIPSSFDEVRSSNYDGFNLVRKDNKLFFIDNSGRAFRENSN